MTDFAFRFEAVTLLLFSFLIIALNRTVCVLGKGDNCKLLFIDVKEHVRIFSFVFLISVAVFPACDLHILADGIAGIKDISTLADLPFPWHTQAALFAAIAARRSGFADISLISEKDIIANLKEAIIICDVDNKIVKFNRAFLIGIPGADSIKRFDDVGKLADLLRSRLYKPEEHEIVNAIEKTPAENVAGELNFDEPPGKCFVADIRPLADKKGEYSGKAVSLRDVTEYKCLMNQLCERNIELLDRNGELLATRKYLMTKNYQLKEYLSEAEARSAEKVRSRLAQELHDTMGYTMTAIKTLLEVSRIACRNNPSMAESKLAEAAAAARKGLNELKGTVSGLPVPKIARNSLMDALKELMAGFEPLGLKVWLEVEGGDFRNCDRHSDDIYRICREALTNSLRHGKADNVFISLKCTDNILKISITDNGYGCGEFTKGMGISGMEERVKSLRGKIFFNPVADAGFTIYVEIPLGVINDD